MTVQDKVLARSTLPQNGTFTMLQHALSGHVTVYGVYAEVETALSVSTTDIIETTHNVVVVEETSDTGITEIVIDSVVDTQQSQGA